MSMTSWFGIVAVLALALTFLSRRTHDILLRIGAALCLLAMLIYLLVGGDTSLVLSNPCIQALAFALLVMVIVPLSWQMKSDISYEAKRRGKIGGYPGASTESWTEWGPRKKLNQKPTTMERQAEFSRGLKEKSGRK